MPSADIVLKFLDGQTRNAKVASMLAVGAMAHEARKRCEDLISARDHSLKDLADMGHPYATRAPQVIHDPGTVHVQSGALVSGLAEEAPTANSSGAMARVVNNERELDERIQIGTPTMVARPYMRIVRVKYAEQIVAAGAAVMRARMKKAS